MEKTTKDKTIDELLIQRKLLIERISSWWGVYHTSIPAEIIRIDNLIMRLNEIKS